MSYRDIIADLLDRLPAAGVDVPRDVRRRVEQDARAEWGGSKHYVPRFGDQRCQQHAERDARIRNAWRSGQPIDELAKAWGLSRRRIEQIIQTLRNGLP